MEQLVTLAELGPLAAGALVDAMVHDSWDAVKEAFMRLTHRNSRKTSSATADALEETRMALLAVSDEERQQLVARYEAWWAGHLEAFAALDNGYETALRDFLKEAKQYLRSIDQSQTEAQISVRAGRDAFVAGRDQIIRR